MMHFRAFYLGLVLLLGLIARRRAEESPKHLYVCQAGDPKAVGVYEMNDTEEDGAVTYLGEGGLSLWRHMGFWYVGDKEPFPPDTHYRCVKGCGRNLQAPPLSGYSKAQQHGKDPAPVFQLEPCEVLDEL
eukprot:CAMPEP_0113941934 /NCGR_PEP_ID=MMETSP1339-20121228/7756_1 /TAXON_ID=94617 /ORGANISM="Fibrocapsa japonica" /LENGTH=129 /DNA_ID=CAMNT_0000946219 /DNA_START=58 /DNA_END=447 /DNA_ORIENTATION=- /assembly_acc=CAM_ASM_000762